MTPGEVARAIESKNRVRKIEAQERATYDYILGNYIVKGVSIILSGQGTLPSINEAYPGVFEDLAQKQEEAKREHAMNLSALRFRQFAQSYNKKFKCEEVPKKINE